MKLYLTIECNIKYRIMWSRHYHQHQSILNDRVVILTIEGLLIIGSSDKFSLSSTCIVLTNTSTENVIVAKSNLNCIRILPFAIFSDKKLLNNYNWHLVPKILHISCHYIIFYHMYTFFV